VTSTVFIKRIIMSFYVYRIDRCHYFIGVNDAHTLVNIELRWLEEL